jgi:hypothetical protein
MQYLHAKKDIKKVNMVSNNFKFQTPRLEHLHRDTANPQIAYDREFAKTHSPSAASYRKSTHKSIKFCVYGGFIAANLSDFGRYLFYSRKIL